ncbi:MAG: hypothetical protein OEX02_07755 [Cyclobacteriaceae bacterium]|nr:hypothetical protein [Cyclobacteriaceae bacterium]
MDIVNLIVPVVAVAVLAGGWAAVQVLAKRMGTKNHIEHGGACGGKCTCMGGGSCEREGNA